MAQTEKRGFTDQKRRIATEADCKARWGGEPNGARFRCYLCAHRFVPGDGWRWVYSLKHMNFLTCDACDGDDVKERWAQRNAEFRADRFWALQPN